MDGAVVLDAVEKAVAIARVAYDNKAEDVVVMRVKDLLEITDYFVVCTIFNRRHGKTLFLEIERFLKEKGVMPLGVEGVEDGRWILMDYDDVVLHMFQPAQREYYSLEELWLDAPRVEWRSSDEADKG